MGPAIWTRSEFIDNTVEYGEREFGDHADEWIASVNALAMKATSRGDGIAVYANADFGSRDIGQWQIVSFGGPDAQLRTDSHTTDYGGAPLDRFFVHEGHTIPKTLPDIGHRINWRYQLHAILPAKAAAKKCLACDVEVIETEHGWTEPESGLQTADDGHRHYVSEVSA